MSSKLTSPVSFYFLNVAIRKILVTYVAYNIFLLDNLVPWQYKKVLYICREKSVETQENNGQKT